MDDEHVGLDDRGGLCACPGYLVTQRLPTSFALVGRARALRAVDGLEVHLTCLVVTPHLEGDAVGRKASLHSGMVAAAQISRIRHEHLVRVHDVIPVTDEETAHDQVVLATALARGGTLSRHLDQVGQLSLSQTITLVVPIGEALQHVHRAGVVHAQLTSEAVVFTADGKPLLCDVGIPQITGTSPTAWPAGREWVAPEVLEGYESSVESDVYAFTALVWHVLSGDPPARIGGGGDLDERVADLPAAIREVLHRGLAVDPEARPDVAEIVAEFQAAGAAEPISVNADHLNDVPTRIRAMAARRPVSHRAPARRPPHAAAAIVAVLLLVAVVVGAFLLPDRRASLGDPMTGGGASAAGSTGYGTPETPGTPVKARASKTARVPDRTTVTTGPSTSPGDILARVLRARADAWQSGDPERLRQAHAAGSEALVQDLADLRSATVSGAQFRDVDFVAHDIEVTEVVPAGSRDLESASQFTAEATVDRGRLRVVNAEDQIRTVPPSSELVRFTLRRDPEGWRFWSWDAVDS